MGWAQGIAAGAGLGLNMRATQRADAEEERQAEIYAARRAEFDRQKAGMAGGLSVASSGTGAGGDGADAPGGATPQAAQAPRGLPMSDRERDLRMRSAVEFFTNPNGNSRQYEQDAESERAMHLKRTGMNEVYRMTPEQLDMFASHVNVASHLPMIYQGEVKAKDGTSFYNMTLVDPTSGKPGQTVKLNPQQLRELALADYYAQNGYADLAHSTIAGVDAEFAKLVAARNTQTKTLVAGNNDAAAGVSLSGHNYDTLQEKIRSNGVMEQARRTEVNSNVARNKILNDQAQQAMPDSALLEQWNTLATRYNQMPLNDPERKKVFSEMQVVQAQLSTKMRKPVPLRGEGSAVDPKDYAATVASFVAANYDRPTAEMKADELYGRQPANASAAAPGLAELNKQAGAAANGGMPQLPSVAASWEGGEGGRPVWDYGGKPFGSKREADAARSADAARVSAAFKVPEIKPVYGGTRGQVGGYRLDGVPGRYESLEEARMAQEAYRAKVTQEAIRGLKLPTAR